MDITYGKGVFVTISDNRGTPNDNILTSGRWLCPNGAYSSTPERCVPTDPGYETADENESGQGATRQGSDNMRKDVMGRRGSADA